MIFCREWLAQLEQHKGQLQAAGLQVIGVGLGEPKHARRYCGKLAPSMHCLVDDTNHAHETYGLRQGKAGELLTSLVATGRAMARGHRQGEATGDVKMLPGTFIVDREGTVRYAYYSKHAGDHPAIKDLVSAAEAMA